MAIGTRKTNSAIVKRDVIRDKSEKSKRKNFCKEPIFVLKKKRKKIMAKTITARIQPVPPGVIRGCQSKLMLES